MYSQPQPQFPFSQHPPQFPGQGMMPMPGFMIIPDDDEPDEDYYILHYMEMLGADIVLGQRLLVLPEGESLATLTDKALITVRHSYDGADLVNKSLHHWERENYSIRALHRTKLACFEYQVISQHMNEVTL
jgi:hypothetical protein